MNRSDRRDSSHLSETETTSVSIQKEKEQTWFGSAEDRAGGAQCSVASTGSDGAHCADVTPLQQTTASMAHRYIRLILSSSYI